jgi:hypothetical protein
MDKNAPGSNATESALTHRDDIKIDRILAALKLAQGLNRFQAEKLGDHCLNSTVAKLREYGYQLHGEWEVVPTRYSPKGVRVKRYRVIGGPQ